MAMVLLIVACTAEEDERTAAVGDSMPVAFHATMEGEQPTRALNITDLTAMQATDKGFGVFGCYTGLYKYSDSNVHPDFMYNEHVTYNTDKWTYSPVKYWPNGEGQASVNTGENPHYVSFMAYAPWTEDERDEAEPDASTHPEEYCISAFSAQGALGNPWLTYRLIPQANLDKQVDLLYAVAQLDQKKPITADPIVFQFNHALACVGNKIGIECSEGLQNQTDSRIVSPVTNARVDVTGIEIVYTLTSKARLVLWNRGEANWQAIVSEVPTCTRTVTLLDPEDPADDKTVYVKHSDIPSAITPQNLWEGSGVFYIPIELSGFEQQAQVTITYRLGNYNGAEWVFDKSYSGTATLVLKNYEEAYQPGKHLYINVELNQMNISLTAAIASWIEVTKQVEGIED